MSATFLNKVTSMKRLLSRAITPLAAVSALALSAAAQAAAPGITGPTFNLQASAGYVNQPDGNQVYTWGYGCVGTPAGFAPSAMAGTCTNMQLPGPTLIVKEGVPVTVNLTNNLPLGAGNTSIIFSGFNVTATGGSAGLLAQEAAPAGGTVSYTFTPGAPGTHSYYSGSQSDLQVDMGLYGAIIVLPANPPANCGSLGYSSTAATGLPAANPGGNSRASALVTTSTSTGGNWHPTAETDFRLATAAYDHPDTCYDREYLFQFAEMDQRIHNAARDQVAYLSANATTLCPTATAATCKLAVPTEPYHPNYFLINGRSMPDDMDPNYDTPYPHQPYNGNPHMHPGEEVLIRVIGQGRWQHPFHEHGNHVRILGRDGNLLTSASTITFAGTTAAAPALSGRLEFTTTTTPGQAFDGIFYWTGRGLNWDAYGHNPGSADALATLTCTPDLNGYNTSAPTAANYYEWCADHNKPLQAFPFGDVPGGGPATLPDANIFTNGAWYGGSPYLGQDATTRATGPTTALLPSNVQGNPAGERGFAFMWHSHNEREITTNNVFPGGMFMMMLVDSREFVIDESK